MIVSQCFPESEKVPNMPWSSMMKDPRILVRNERIVDNKSYLRSKKETSENTDTRKRRHSWDDDPIPKKSKPLEKGMVACLSVDILPSEPSLIPLPPEEEDDDVILNEVPPIVIVVDDDDTDIEIPFKGVPEPRAVKCESLDNEFVEVFGTLSWRNGELVRVKSEPIDSDDAQLVPNSILPAPTPLPAPIEVDEPPVRACLDQQSLIDGNPEMISSNGHVSLPFSMVGGNRIKINFKKNALPVKSKEMEVETSKKKIVDLGRTAATLKPALRGVKLRNLPPVSKDNDYSGICSIM